MLVVTQITISNSMPTKSQRKMTSIRFGDRILRRKIYEVFEFDAIILFNW